MRPLPFLLFLVSVLCVFWISCHKKRSDKPYVPPYPKNHTAAMAGARLWAGVYTSGYFPTTSQNDTQHYAVTIINDSLVTIAPDTLVYTSLDTANSAMLFKRHSTVFSFRQLSVTYYFSADSMVYDYYNRFTTCCFDQRVVHTIH